MLKLLFGMALAPAAGSLLWVSARSVARLASGSIEAAPFIAGAGLCALGRLFIDFRRSCLGRSARAVYVFGHEFTHALSAWALGGSVHAFKVGEDGGRVDLSRSNAFIALAPYCLPLYTIVTAASYRAWLFFDPALGGTQVFLALMGATLCFHLLFTFDCLWAARQPDLAAAGGTGFSLSVIGLCNGLFLLLFLKVLFPGSVSLWGSLQEGAKLTAGFWVGAADLIRTATVYGMKQLKGGSP